MGRPSPVVTEVRILPLLAPFGSVAQQQPRSPYDLSTTQLCSEIAVSTPSIPLPFHEDPADDIPEALQGIAQRLQAAINEVLVAKEAAHEPSTSVQLSDVGERGSAADSVVAAGAAVDRRLYFPDSEGWECRVKSGPREYCSHRNPGEEWFHLLLDGELFLQFGEEKVCLNCAYRSGLLTDDRLFWQKGHRRQRIHPVPDTAPEIDANSETSAEHPEQPLTTYDILENPTESQT